MIYFFKENCKFIVKKSFNILSIIYGIIGFFSIIIPFNDLILKGISVDKKFILVIHIALFIYVIIIILTSLYYYNQKRFIIFKVNNGNILFINYGDIFSKEITNTTNNKRNIVIPFDRSFNIDINSINDPLQKDFVKKAYDSGLYSEQTLKSEIKSQLNINNYNCSNGIYEIGSTVIIDLQNGERYFLIALCKRNKAKYQINVLEYYSFLLAMNNMCYLNSNGAPVLIPLVGSGMSNINRSEQDMLSIIVTSFVMCKNLINVDTYIVVPKEKKNNISIIKYKDFS